MRTRPVLFLDFDGVLHPNRCAPEECFCLLPTLVETIAPFELDIVISSSWRIHYSLRYLRKLFPATVRNRIVGTTGEPFPGPNARWQEIQEYLLECPTNNWRALDDFDFEFPPDCAQLIHCDGARGCQGPELLQVQRWLGGRAGARFREDRPTDDRGT